MPVEQGRLYSIKQSNCQRSEQDGFHIRKVTLNTPQKSSVWLPVSKNLSKLETFNWQTESRRTEKLSAATFLF